MLIFDASARLVVTESLIEDIETLLQNYSPTRVGLIVDGYFEGNQKVHRIQESLSKKYHVDLEFIQGKEPTTKSIDQLTEKYRSRDWHFLIGIGGGSTLDTVKALSVMLLLTESVVEYHGTGKPFLDGIPKILIPTTAGTGSEVTPGAVLLNEETDFKRSIGGKHVTADYAILDPELTLSMPESVTARSGMDAIGHCVESYTALNANEITRMYSKKAFEFIYPNLPKVFEEPDNIVYRKAVLIGSSLAGYAICNSNTGACHSMSYALGIYHDVPHGLAVGLLLPKVVQINIQKGCTDYADLYDLIEGLPKNLSKQEKAIQFGELLSQYKPAQKLGGELADFGIEADKIDSLASHGLDLTPALSNNPVPFDLNDSKEVLLDSLSKNVVS